MVTRALLVLLLWLAASPGAARCRLALAVAMDVSSSVDADEDVLQRSGIASALKSPEVQTAFLASPHRVAVAVYEWSGRYNQELLVDWTLIETAADLERIAGQVQTSARSHNDFPTAMGYALGYGATLLARAPTCDAQTIDMAGDGQNNEGFGPAEAYAAFPFDGVTVNGLVVNGADFEAETGLIAFYQTQVIRGPAAFVEVAQGFEDYARAMRRKLEREVTPPVVGGLYDRHGQGD
ncbi:MAG: DUF1194 domain-containing protein [Pseudomonadota bacterium]